ncbi:ATP-binding protein [Christiangramia fulva]|nr:ATP-binding protein [Christiangramia fulva]
MKLTKEQEAEIMPIYEKWWHSYLNGDVKTYDHYLDDHYRFVGSTEAEDFLNKLDTTKFFDDTAEQLAGKTQKRNSKLTTEYYDGIVFITELADAYLLFGDEWTFYGKFRFSSMLRKRPDGWRFIYQHFSVPDSKAQEGETIGFEQVSKENQELRDAIKRRTAELENKNRELEIETALERVRARTMAMQHSNELTEASEILDEQVRALGIQTWGCAFHIYANDPDGDYEWFSSREGTLPFYKTPRKNFFLKFYEKGKAGEAFHVEEFIGEDCKAHYEFLMTIPVMGDALREIVASGGQLPESQFDHIAFFKHGFLLFITYKPVPESHSIFQRFAKVFEQTYTRFLDLQKAEAQAKEAKIEAALERVRSRTMAMQHSDELQEAAILMFDQIAGLDVNLIGCGFNIWDEDQKSATAWMSGLNRIQLPFKTSSSEDIFKRIYEAAQRGDTLFVEEQSGEELEAHYKYMASIPEFQKIIDNLAVEGLTTPSFQVMHCAFFQQGYLMFITPEPMLEAKEVFKRFAKVFEQTYTRFLDLQKAEAQAREAQIEAGLERVRARSMAMQRTDELQEAAEVLNDELIRLGLRKINQCGYGIYNEEKGNQVLWLTRPGGTSREKFTLPIQGETILNERYNSWKQGDPLCHQKVTKKQFESHLNLVFDQLGSKVAQDIARKEMPDNPHFYCANFRDGYLHIVADEALDTEQEQIMVRFARVFSQTYTRFLDLQKAEAQAREAQIEAGLERVRSRTMAMQSSEELADVAFVLFEQLRGLGGNLWGTGFGLCKKDSDMDSFWFANEHGVFPPVSIPNTTDPAHKQMFEGWKAGKDILTIEAGGKKLKRHYEYMLSLPEVKPFFQKIIDEGLTFPKWQQWNAAYFEHGYLLIISLEPYSNAEVLVRFAKVFDQTYTRFLDLKKAEAQAREAKIEAALERVRARTMAMHKSAELKEVIQLIYDQFGFLGINIEHTGFILDYKENEDMHIWLADQQNIPAQVVIPYFDAPHWNSFKKAKGKGENFFVNHHDAAKTRDFYQKLFKVVPDFPEEEKEFYLSRPGLDISTVLGDNIGLYIERFSGKSFSDQDNSILRRFAKVFEQTYTRFLDLQKAEAQAREAKIETALEKVRSRSLAMHNSDELNEVVKVLFEKMTELEIPSTAVGIQTFSEDSKDMQCFICGDVGTGMVIDQYLLPYFDHPILNDYLEAYEKSPDYYVGTYSKKEKDSLYEVVLDLPELKDIPAEVKTMIRESEFYEITMVPAKKSLLAVNDFQGNPLSESQISILKRFAKVFDQAFIRFLDLQNVEERAREAQIEAALERVRSRTMAMHKSEELAETAAVLFEQLRILGNTPERINLGIFKEEENLIEWWITTQDGLLIENNFITKFDDHPVLMGMFKAWKEKKKSNVIKLQGEDVKDWVQYITKVLGMPVYPELVKEQRVLSSAYFSQGLIGTTTSNPLQMETIGLLERFAAVFQQTYTRFLDLQKAEAQAKEAKIETALEKIRSRTMGMQSSEELPEVANLLFLEVQDLGIPAWSCGYCILMEDRGSSTCIMSSEGTLQKPFLLRHTGEASFLEWDGFVHSDKTFFTQELEGDAIESHYNYMKSLPQLKLIFQELIDAGLSLPTYQINHLCKFSHGFLLFITYEPVPDAHDIFRRFTKVFDQTYTRFLDLEKAEAREKEAVKQASLDRVRGEIASMRTTKDLERITPVIWKELTVLGVPFFRCGVFIIREDEEMVHAYLSKPDGASVAAIHIPFDDKDNKLIEPMIQNWRQQKTFKEKWDRKQFIQQTRLFVDKGQIENPQSYPIVNTPPENLVLHLVPFKQGMLYIGHEEDLTKEQISLVESLSKAFSVAYSRYEDFKALENTKNSLEHTIKDLKSTQAQLIQAEKMASLGQLTAGIAHEIKNPLNFVNNFSEVSKELLEEMSEELKNGNYDLVAEIAGDVNQNLEKILHHGKRADGIVKGMLEHSRSSSGKKEEINVNSFVDEYLRLAYHGLRAKDKSFNATMKTDFDPKTGKIEAVPQELGRVILNLVTNAFYAVSEKKILSKAQKNNEYEPRVWISTRRTKDQIEIKVRDNGMGIPEEIREKIFQPFFTTKPTGEGTGLGLSLSYDIVKAHGGKIEIKSTPGQGSTFIIQLPK